MNEPGEGPQAGQTSCLSNGSHLVGLAGVRRDRAVDKEKNREDWGLYWLGGQVARNAI